VSPPTGSLLAEALASKEPVLFKDVNNVALDTARFSIVLRRR
jgi:hypothetical protein